MQGQNFKADVLALPLGNYDLVLGIQWLVELGDILWNFKELQMKFVNGGQECVLQCYKRLPNSVLTISGDKMDKVLGKVGQLAMLQCYELQLVGYKSERQSKRSCQGVRIVCAEMKQVFQVFREVF